MLENTFNTIKSIILDVFLLDEHPLMFTEITFWVFFALVLLVIGFIKKKNKLRNAFLFIASVFFYYKTSGFFFSILLFSTISDFYLGKAIFSSKKKTTKKTWLAISIITNLSVLIFFKYAYFFADSFNELFGTSWHPINHFAQFSNDVFGSSFRVDYILLPVGISFFTFQTLSYAIDIYREKVTPVKSLLDFGFYVSFFPQLVAGPIVRAAHFIPQLYKPYCLSKQQFGMALFWIINGLLKKFLLADYLAVNFVDRIFDNPGMFTGLENLMGLYGYSLQVYADFSGYTDIAIGVAWLMGFNLPKNFDSPYKADSCGNFWKRWHISLSSWLKDYLYIPMGGNKGGSLFSFIALGFVILFLFLLSGSYTLLFGTITLLLVAMLIGVFVIKLNNWYLTNINIMLTMLIGGLWHGASWNFVLWGGLNGLGIVIYKLWNKISPWKNKEKTINRIWGIFLTFNFISFTRIWFRSGSSNGFDEMDQGHNIISEWFTANDMLIQLFSNFRIDLFFEVVAGYHQVFIIMILGFLIHWLPEKWKVWYRYKFSNANVFIQLLTCLLVVFILFQFASSELQPFIYFQF